MVERLRRAVDLVTQEAERLTDAEQDALAAQLEALANDLRWEEVLGDPAYTAGVDVLADEALAEYFAIDRATPC
jgi:hypothetical protein